MKKTIIGLVEKVILKGENIDREVNARIDTGAQLSSIDMKLATELKLGPITRTKKIRSANGSMVRPILEIEIKIDGQEIKEEFTLSNRENMSFPVLIGQNILKKGFLIDPLK
tara:strand:- start:64 stop:399 length:336 start_codon:yes stop_codon:yes gene_type:complete